VFKAADVDHLFQRAAATWGNPASVLSDNGAVYTGRYRGQGRVALEVTLNRRGIRFTHSRPYHPQTCGKVERFHQTEKRWLATQPPATTIARLQRQLDNFVAYYNTVRPHRALGRHTPTDAYTARPQATPAGLVLDDAGWRVRHDVIDGCGRLTLRHNSQLHHIGIGRRHARRRVLLLIKDLHVRVTTTDGELLRDFELDPTRNYQPQPKT
jgi:Integrase core domain